MAEKLAEVYDKYDIEILSSKRGRGATILTTTDGLRILEPFRGSVIRLEQEHVLKGLFEEEGFVDLDVILPNREGELLTNDRYHQPFVLKKHFEGEECDMRNLSEVVRAVDKLAEFHIYGNKVACLFRSEWQRVKCRKEKLQREEIQQAIAAGEEPEQVARMYGVTPVALKEMLKEKGKSDEEMDKEAQSEELGINQRGEDVLELFLRRNRELRKIRKFVGGVRRKNNFENLFLKVYPEYYSKGIRCEVVFGEVMRDEAEQMKSEEKKVMDEAKKVRGKERKEKDVPNENFNGHRGICHGNFNQHNVILGKGGEAIVHFERFSTGNQLDDLYQFARKVMEKNHYDYEMLDVILDTYANSIPLSKADYRYIYVLFSYPEKFWKIANGYYNSNKAFLSPKYIEKLKTVIEQEKEKSEMLSQYYTFHLQ